MSFESLYDFMSLCCVFSDANTEYSCCEVACIFVGRVFPGNFVVVCFSIVRVLTLERHCCHNEFFEGLF